MIKLSVISPVRNEEGVLDELVSRTSKTLKKSLGDAWEFIVVDDASTDMTKEIMDKIAKNNRNVVYLRREKRGGQTGCFKTGFDAAKGSYVMTMDGDLEVQPEDIPLFLAKIDQGYDVINGIREHRKHRFWVILASRIFNTLMLLFFNCPVFDAASNYTAFRADLIKNLPLRSNDHRYLIPMMVRRGAKRIGEVVVCHSDRTKGKSKYRVSVKFLKGGPEIIHAWIRLKRGAYDMPGSRS